MLIILSVVSADIELVKKMIQYLFLGQKSE